VPQSHELSGRVCTRLSGNGPRTTLGTEKRAPEIWMPVVAGMRGAAVRASLMVNSFPSRLILSETSSPTDFGVMSLIKIVRLMSGVPSRETRISPWRRSDFSAGLPGRIAAMVR